MYNVEFDESLVTGNEMIDEQHKELIGKIQDLLRSCEKGSEKATANLIAYDKTEELALGQSQTVKISFVEDDLASYDYKNARAYVLEQGDYNISIRQDSHHIIDSKNITVDSTITYNTAEHTHSQDQKVATNVLMTYKVM